MSEVVTERAPTPMSTRGRRLPGEVGIWVFVLGDMTMFSAFFGQFMFDRQHAIATFTAGQAHSHVTFGAINTILLLSGSLFIVNAVRAVRVGDLRIADRWLALAFGSGAVFLVNKVLEYADKLHHGLTPTDSLYFTYYFMFTGIHAIHLIAALVVVAYLRCIVRRSIAAGTPIGPRTGRAIEVGATYWHLVDLLWVVLFALLYLMA